MDYQLPMSKKNSVHPHETHLLSSVPLIAIACVVLVLGYVFSTVTKSLDVQNQLVAKQTQYDELKSRGFNPDPVSVRKIEVAHTWQANNLSYNVRSAYLTPDIADFVDRRTKLGIGTENKFLVVEVDIADIRAQGEKRDVEIAKYLQPRGGNKSFRPVSPEDLTLGPRQNSTEYVIYVVPMETSDFILTTGTGRTKMTTLKFAESEVEAMQGVFLTTQGFATEFPQE